MIEEYKKQIETCKTASRIMMVVCAVLLIVGGIQFMSAGIVAAVIAFSEMSKVKLYETLIGKQLQIDAVIAENQIIKGNWDRMYTETQKLRATAGEQN